MTHERRAIRAMRGYTPGKQPAGDATKLNTNENPYPPSDAVMAALRSIEPEALRRYPPPTAAGLRDELAERHGVDPESVVVTNGGDELLRLAVTTYVEHGRPIGMIEPSYSLYPVLASIHESPVVTVDATETWDVPDDFAMRMNDGGVELAFLVNPHAPSGRLVPTKTLEAIATTLRGVLLVDEAYVDFVDPALGHDAVALVRRLDNVLLLRTLSKGYSLAGLRLGYGIGAPSLIAPMLEKTRDSYNVDAVAQRLAKAAILDRAYAASTWERVRAERERMTAELVALGFDVPSSESNFVLATVPSGGPSASSLHDALEARAILVRYFATPRLDDKLRITIGTRAQNDRLLEALVELLQKP